MVSYVCIAAAALFCALALLVLVTHALLAWCASLRQRHLSSGAPRKRAVVEPRAAAAAAYGNDEQYGVAWLWSVPPNLALWRDSQGRRLGVQVARRPWTTLAITTGIALVAACGLSMIKVHRDALTMWLPAGSAAQVNEAEYALLTGRPRPRSLVVLIEWDGASAATGMASPASPLGRPPPPSPPQPWIPSSSSPLPSPPPAPTSVKAALARAMDIHEAVRSCGLHNVSAGSGLSESDGVFSPLQLWDYSRDVLDLDTDPLGTIEGALFAGGGGSVGGQGGSIDGGVTVGVLRSMVRLAPPPSDALASASELSALLLVYNLDGGLEAKSAVVEFERRVRKMLSAEGGVWTTPDGRPPLPINSSVREAPLSGSEEPSTHVHVFSESALSDDLYAAVGDDTLMIGASITMMCFYVTIFLSRHHDLLRLRSIPSGAAVLSVMLATLSAFGTAAALGVEYNDNVNMGAWLGIEL